MSLDSLEEVEDQTKTGTKNRRIIDGIFIFLVIFSLSLGFVAIFYPDILENILAVAEETYGTLLEDKETMNPISLVFIALLGGILGSISPCVLAMLPLNLGYIGTLKINSRLDALRKAGAFVAGVVLVSSLFGLASGFAGAVLVDWRGHLFIGISIFIVVMAVVMLEWIQIPLPQFIKRVPDAGPFTVGIAFTLISSPCASPVLASVLILAASSGSVVVSTITMAAYGVGYTIIIFFASLFTGLAKQVGTLKFHGTKITRFSAVLLLLLGFWTFYQGLDWFGYFEVAEEISDI